MNRAQKMLAVLKDGKPHSRLEIQEQAGYFLTNNAASELRDYGYDVQKWNEGRNVIYQLVGSLNELEVDSASPSGSLSVSTDPIAAQTNSSPADSPLPVEPGGTLILFECDIDESAGMRGAYWDDAA